MYPGRFEAVASQWEVKPSEKTEKQIFEEFVELAELAEGTLWVVSRETWIVVPSITYGKLEKVVRRAEELGYLIDYISAIRSNIHLYVAGELNAVKVRKLLIGKFWNNNNYGVSINPLTSRLNIYVEALFEEISQNRLLDIIRYVEKRVKKVGYRFIGISAKNDSIILSFKKF